MKVFKLKVIAYLFLIVVAGYATTSCEPCYDGNNWEDQESATAVDTLSVE